MRVLHINTNIHGGAAAAAIRIHKAQIEAGFDSHILFLKGKPPTDIPNAHVLSEFIFSPFVYLLDKLNRALNYRFQIGRPECFFNSPRSLFRLHSLDFVKGFDVINLHWIVKFIDIPSFFTKLKKPIVWTMHDMCPFTGGYHYRTEYPEKEYAKLSERFWNIKRKAFSKADITMVGPSLWLCDEAKKSGIFSDKTKYVNIKYAIDLELFSPVKELSNVKSMVLFVAEKSGDKRKGIDYLYKALDKIDHGIADFVVLGKGGVDCPDYIQSAGYITSQEIMADWYRKASLFVIPSLEDNLPNTVIEAMACGIPVVGFDAGGIKHMIIHKENGFLVPTKDVEKLAEGILYVLNHHNKEQLSKTARAFAEKHFNNETITNQYKQLYESLLQGG